MEASLDSIRNAVQASIILQLAIILIAVKTAGLISRKMKQPAVFGKLLIGIIIGPSVLNILTGTQFLKGLAEVGVILLMFLAGLETELDRFRETGKVSILSAIGGVVFPLAGGIWLGLTFDMTLKQAIFIGITLTATSVSISVQTLREMGRLRTKEGFTILGAAVLDDILGIIILSLLLGVVAGADSDDLLVLILKIAVFLLGTVFVGKWVVIKAFQFAKRAGVRQGLVPLGLIFCFLLTYLAQLGGVANITGAYLAGILINVAGFGNVVYDKVESLSYNLFVPVFLISIGIGTQVADIGNSLTFVGLLIVVAILSKALGGGMGALLGGFNLRNSLAVGTGLVSRGEIALIVASLGLSKGLITGNIFVSLVVMVLVTTVITPLMLKWSLK